MQVTEEVILDHLSLVRSLASITYWKLSRVSGEHKDDLYSAGSVGLMEAARDFDVKYGVSFSTFAYARIKGAIVDYLRSLDWVGRRAREVIKAYEEAVRELAGTGKECDRDSLMKVLGLTDKAMNKLSLNISLSRVESLQEPCDFAGTKHKKEDRLTSLFESPLEALLKDERREVLNRAVARMAPRHQETLSDMFILEKSRAEIAAENGLTVNSISVRRTTALRQLKKYLPAAA